MNITTESRHYIEEIVNKSKHQTLRFYGISACCGARE